MNNKSQGFSLIELLIVVAVLGILAAMVMNSSSSSAEKARLASAKSVMIEIQGKQERYSINQRKYGSLANLGYSSTLYIDDDGSSTTQAKGFYKITMENDDFTFTITAEPIRSQAANKCGTLTLDQDGAKTAAEAKCW